MKKTITLFISTFALVSFQASAQSLKEATLVPHIGEPSAAAAGIADARITPRYWDRY
jgi:hypothetical protein